VSSVHDVRWQELGEQECFGLLAGRHLGRVDHYVRIVPASLTGRRIALPEDAPSTWWGSGPRRHADVRTHDKGFRPWAGASSSKPSRKRN
jgi:hypothetical protein